jgi:hypothetical protein
MQDTFLIPMPIPKKDKQAIQDTGETSPQIMWTDYSRDLQHISSEGDQQHMSSEGDLQHISSEGDQQHMSSEGDLQRRVLKGLQKHSGSMEHDRVKENYCILNNLSTLSTMKHNSVNYIS